MPPGPKPRFFAGPARFRAWLEKHHASATELLVGFYKVGTGKPSITWPESVDQALCFGWIDGVRRSLGDESYTIRFTPRRPRSIWSAVNIARAGELIAGGLMRPAGLAAFRARTGDRSGIYSYEQRHAAQLAPEQEAMLRATPKAWQFFQAQPPSYRKAITHWVTSARKEETRLRRLARLIEGSANGQRLDRLDPGAPAGRVAGKRRRARS
ncbi:MAG TPA: YdeI/OmpD-associated family protein [Kofleriaceae bacterium]|nr:YdeI/OmpD-associated family protein [Kofleriaceae bacterium]